MEGVCVTVSTWCMVVRCVKPFIKIAFLFNISTLIYRTAMEGDVPMYNTVPSYNMTRIEYNHAK